MTALRNMAADLAAQFRLRGSLVPRLLLVALLQGLYVLSRLSGRSQGASLDRARGTLSRLGLSGRRAALYHPDAGWIETDLLSAAYLAKDILVDGQYEERPGFAPTPGQTVLDVGAHHGLFALRAAARVGPGGRVIAVEAYPPNAERLKRNAALRGQGRVAVVEAAALAASGEAELFVTDEVSGGQTTVPRPDRAAIRVPARTLDEILAEQGAPHPDLIKLDIEGAALSALAGATRALEGGPRLVMEVEGGPDKEREAADWLSRRGYNVEIVSPILYAKRGDA